MTTGKKQFERYSSVLLFLTGALRITPKSFRRFLWSLISPFECKLAFAMRYCIFRSLAKGCGNNIYFGPFVVIRSWELLEIGNDVSIHASCYIDASGGIRINNCVSIAHQTSLVSFNHTYSDTTNAIKYNPSEFNEICISDDVWIGCGVRILSGVRIGSRSLIAAGSVVCKDVPGHCLVAGVPARFVKSI